MSDNQRPEKLSRDELIQLLTELRQRGDTEQGHADADDALLAYINDREITELFESIPKWYA